MSHADTRSASRSDPAAGDDPTERFVALTPAGPPGPDTAAAPTAAADRGTLSLDDVVVEKVAAAAADSVDGVGGAARRVLGVPTGSDSGERTAATRPRVSAHVTGQTATIEIRLTVAYPASVRATTEAVRAHVRERVTTLTALSVSRVDIVVAALTSSSPATRRVVA